MRAPCPESCHPVSVRVLSRRPPVPPSRHALTWCRPAMNCHRLLVEAMSRATSRYQSSNRTSGQSVSSVEELGKSADSLRTISEQVAKSTGLSSSQVSQIAFQFSGGVSAFQASARSGRTPQATAGKSYSNQLDWARAEGCALSSQTISSEAVSIIRGPCDRDQTFASALGTEDREGQELASRLSTATTRVESAQSVYAEAKLSRTVYPLHMSQGRRCP